MSQPGRSAGGQRHRRLVKPTKISINGEECSFHTLFKQWTVSRETVNSIEVGRTLSLFDEIAMTVESSGTRFYTPETLPGFQDLVGWLDIAVHFGDSWYRRAEAGDHLIEAHPYPRDDAGQ